MNIDKLTKKAEAAILTAEQLAFDRRHAETLPEHLLLSLVTQRDGIVPVLLHQASIDADQLIHFCTLNYKGYQPHPVAPNRVYLNYFLMI